MPNKSILSKEKIDNITRQALFLTNQLELKDIARQTMEDHKLSTDDFAMFCINSQDPTWNNFLDVILSPVDRETLRNNNETVVKAAITLDLYKNFLESFPQIKLALSEGAAPGIVKVFTFDSGGIYLRGIKLE